MKTRTVREFVEDLLSDGRTSSEILTIAKNTRWKLAMEEIKEVIRSFSKILKKRFQIIEGNDDNKIKSKK